LLDRLAVSRRPVVAAAVDGVLILLFANLTALGAWISIPLPFSPVPITGQTLMVLLAGAILGSRRGAASQLTYLVEGAAGLPVFAGGTAGVVRIVGPTGGYLIGFIVAAALVGWLYEHGASRRPLMGVGAMLVGNVVIYLLGVIWLTRFVGGDPRVALVQGVLPFIPGDILKSLLAAGVIPSARWTLGRWTGRGEDI